MTAAGFGDLSLRKCTVGRHSALHNRGSFDVDLLHGELFADVRRLETLRSVDDRQAKS